MLILEKHFFSPKMLHFKVITKEVRNLLATIGNILKIRITVRSKMCEGK